MVIAAALVTRDVVAVLDDPKPELSSCLLGPFWGAKFDFDILTASVNCLDSEMAAHKTSGMTPSFFA